MIKGIRQRFFTLHHIYDNPIDQQRARLLLLLTWASATVSIIWLLAVFLPRLVLGSPVDFRILITTPVIIIVAYINYRLLQAGRLRFALWLFTIAGMQFVLSRILIPTSFSTEVLPTPVILLVIPLVAAGILTGRRETFLVVFISVIAVIIAGQVQNHPLSEVPDTVQQISVVSVPDTVFALIVVSLFLLGFVNSLEQTAKESLVEIQQRDWISRFATELSTLDGEDAILTRSVNLISSHLQYLLIRVYLTEQDGSITRSVRSGVGQQAIIERANIRVGDTSAIGEAIRTRIPVLLTSQDIPTRRTHMLASASSAIAIPIVSGPDVLGVLDIQSGQQTNFTENEISLLSLMASEMAIILRHVGTVSGLLRALREQESDAKRLQGQLQEFRQRDRQTFGDIWEQYMQGRGGTAIGYDMETSAGPNLVAASDLPQAIYDTLKKGELHTEIMGEEQIINVPIRFRNTTLGAMCFTVPKEQALGERQLEMAEIVAERLALALENTRLFEQSQAQALRERKASEVGSMLIGATDVRTLLNLAAEQFNEALGAVHTQIFIQPDILAEPLARTAKEEVR